MKEVVLKALIILPIIAFIDYVIMIVVGCASCFLGSSNNFYQCAFCTIGKFLFVASILTFLVIVFLDIKSGQKKNSLKVN